MKFPVTFHRANHWKRLGLLSLLLVTGLLIILVTAPVEATDFRSGDRIVIGADEVVDDDLFVAGDSIEINGTVKGDLFAVGREVIVNGDVEGSIFMAGQILEANGEAGSLYAAGYSLSLGPVAELARNLHFNGFSLTTEAESSIGRSLYANGYQVILNGDVANDVVANSGALEINGAVGGDVSAEVASADATAPPDFGGFFPGSVPVVSPGLRLGDDARVEGELDVTETSDVDVDVSPSLAGSLLVGNLTRRLSQRTGEFIALLIVGVSLLAIWPNVVQRSQARAGEKPITNAGIGCALVVVFMVAVPLVCVAVLALATLAGAITFGQLFGAILSLGWALLAVVVVVFLIVLFLVAKVVVSFLVGRWILDRLFPERNPGFWTDFASLALGAFIYELLRFIPILGWLISVVVILVGMGAIFVVLRDTFRPPIDKETPEPKLAT